MQTWRYAIVVVLVLSACSRADDDGPAKQAKPVAADDYLELTEAPLAEVPDLPYRPAHTDAEYLAIEGTALPLRFYIEPLTEQALEGRGVQMQADFQRILGRTVGNGEAQRWKRDMVEDFRRRQMAARALLDLKLAGSLTDEDLDARFVALQNGIDLAFRRITGITAEEHAQLAGG